MAESRRTNYFGDRPMPISGRLMHERERLTGMTVEEREWREKWCKDQELAPDEPKYIPELDRVLTNPIQRLYKTPLNWIFFTKLEPVIGPHSAYVLRNLIPKGLLFYFAILGLWYNLKYHEGTWERQGGWIHKFTKPSIFPGDPGYPKRYEHTPQDFGTRGFNERKVFMDLTIDGTSSRTTKG